MMEHRGTNNLYNIQHAHACDSIYLVDDERDAFKNEFVLFITTI